MNKLITLGVLRRFKESMPISKMKYTNLNMILRQE
jgi:hypothetical protein